MKVRRQSTGGASSSIAAHWKTRGSACGRWQCRRGGRLARSDAPPDHTMGCSPTCHRLAFAVALLWIVHPLNTESVTYIVQRGESLMGLFLLLTLYCAIRASEDGPRRAVWARRGCRLCARHGQQGNDDRRRCSSSCGTDLPARGAALAAICGLPHGDRRLVADGVGDGRTGGGRRTVRRFRAGVQ